MATLSCGKVSFDTIFSGRLLVHLRQQAPVSIYINSLVFPSLHLGSFPLAEFAALPA
jgi:hypothetical protein